MELVYFLFGFVLGVFFWQYVVIRAVKNALDGRRRGLEAASYWQKAYIELAKIHSRCENVLPHSQGLL